MPIKVDCKDVFKINEELMYNGKDVGFDSKRLHLSLAYWKKKISNISHLWILIYKIVVT